MAKKPDMSALKMGFEEINNAENENLELDREIKPAKRVTRMEKKLEKTENLIPNPKNMFNMREDEEYQELIEGLKKDGMQNPIIVMPQNDDGTYTILSGHRRLKAAKEIGLIRVPIMVKNDIVTQSDEIAFISRGNSGARQKYPYDMAAQLRLYYDELEKEGYEGNKSKLAEETFGISKRAIQNYDKLQNLPSIIIEWGSLNYISRDEGLFLEKIMENPRGVETVNVFIEKVKSQFSECSSDKDKSMIIKDMIGNLKKSEKRKATISANKKVPLVNNSIKKIQKIVNTALAEDYSIPKQAAKREAAIQMVDESLKRLKQIKDELESY